MYKSRLYSLVTIWMLIVSIVSFFCSCGKEDGGKKHEKGDPIITDNSPNLPPEAPPEIPEVKPDTTIQALVREVKKLKETPTPTLTTQEPVVTTPVYVPPPPPPPPPPIDDAAGLLKSLNINDLIQRAEKATEGASGAAQKAKSAAALAERTQKQAEAMNCTGLDVVNRELKNANKSADKAAEQQSSVKKSADKTTGMLQSLASMRTSRDIKAGYDNASRLLTETEANAAKTGEYARSAEESASKAINAIEGCKPSVSVDLSSLKQKIAQDMMDLSRDRRNTRLQAAIRSYFSDTYKKGVISTVATRSSYSVEQYITKLNTEGAHQIQISTMDIDEDGKVRSLSLEETKLAK